MHVRRCAEIRRHDGRGVFLFNDSRSLENRTGQEPVAPINGDVATDPALAGREDGGSGLESDFVNVMQLNAAQMVALFLFIVFLLGFLLDWITVVLICLPIFLPQLKVAEVDGIWFAVMVVIVIQTAYLTPPMAPAVFYLRTIAPPEMTYRDMYRGVAPFVVLEAIVLAIVALVPEAATYLPRILVGF